MGRQEGNAATRCLVSGVSSPKGALSPKLSTGPTDCRRHEIVRVVAVFVDQDPTKSLRNS